ncbi:MAG: NADH-quinone oxidoreductase subunit N [Candidatus Methylacidiphilales bacterium]
MTLLPEVVLVLTGVILLLFDAFAPKATVGFLGKLSLAGVLVALASTFTLDPGAGPLWEGLYAVDSLALFFKQFFLITLFWVLAMNFKPAEVMRYGATESFVLPIFCAVGMLVLASAVDFMTLFVGLELVTISFYVMVALRRGHKASLEAGVKYLIIGALSTGFLVYGIAFLYGSTGTTDLSALILRISAYPTPDLALLFAVTLLLTGIGFKLASVPFHVWAPDVYQGAPSPVTAFLSVGSKAAGFVVLLRVFYFSGFSHAAVVGYVAGAIALMAALSVILGNFAALPQRNLKRLLAYSGIGHAGFMLMGLSCTRPGPVFDERGVQAVLVYLVVYMLSALLAFFIISRYEDELGGSDIKAFSGLARRAPLAAWGMLLSFVSMAGIPPLAGFLGKLGIFAALWRTQHYGLLAVGLISAVAGLYYYLKVVGAMYWTQPLTSADVVPVRGWSAVAIALLSILILMLGFWPMPIQWWIEPVLSQGSLIFSLR